tara:strand:- start:1553 stop:1831 length:279 start_codon:yes stop_codon:yes gene_type:complete
MMSVKPKWHLIAKRSLARGGGWRQMLDAKFAINEARRKYDCGEIEIAQRRGRDCMELVVMVRQQRARPRKYFSRMGMPFEQVALLEKWDKLT